MFINLKTNSSITGMCIKKAITSYNKVKISCLDFFLSVSRIIYVTIFLKLNIK